MSTAISIFQSSLSLFRCKSVTDSQLFLQQQHCPDFSQFFLTGSIGVLYIVQAIFLLWGVIKSQSNQVMDYFKPKTGSIQKVFFQFKKKINAKLFLKKTSGVGYG